MAILPFYLEALASDEHRYNQYQFRFILISLLGYHGLADLLSKILRASYLCFLIYTHSNSRVVAIADLMHKEYGNRKNIIRIILYFLNTQVNKKKREIYAKNFMMIN